MGGTPPFTLQIVIPGWTAGGVRALWVSTQPPRCMHIWNIFSPLILIELTNKNSTFGIYSGSFDAIVCFFKLQTLCTELFAVKSYNIHEIKKTLNATEIKMKK